ncbi:MAG TPA: VOC family protein [Pirellulales bacterium]|nr:VOC family protein [Pirellulales bacterium]
MAKTQAAKKPKKKAASKRNSAPAKRAATKKATPRKPAVARKSAFSGASVIKGVHTMFYSSEPDALRTFLRETLRLPYTDVGQGWLIFDLPEADMGCHPSDPAQGGSPSGTQNISFYCDDIHKSVAELKARGVEFTHEIADHGYGLVTFFKVPGGFDVQLYQPRYEK